MIQLDFSIGLSSFANRSHVTPLYQGLYNMDVCISCQSWYTKAHERVQTGNYYLLHKCYLVNSFLFH